MSYVIKVENLSKAYIIGHQKQDSYQTLRDTLMHTARGLYQRVRHPLSPNRELIDIEEFWALKNIGFEVKQGDRVGIIGRNGAGKSTLLKILSRITEPTFGRVSIRGRVASLLEVGTGFHPELTGRENIFLNGAILGMTRQEIKKKFDEIVDFSEIEKFLDTPVKRYSSGMYVRLAFAVAAHLEPEILIVDEVLAVGDAAFQKKCLGKMKEAGKEGRTILFVSHNMEMIKKVSNTGILLKEGMILDDGSINDIVDLYLGLDKDNPAKIILSKNSFNASCEDLDLLSIGIMDKNSTEKTRFQRDETIVLRIKYKVINELRGMRMNVSLITEEGIIAFSDTDMAHKPNKVEKGKYISLVTIPPNLLNKKTYSVNIHFGIPGVRVLLSDQNYLSFNVIESEKGGVYVSNNWPGVVRPILGWQIEKIS